MGSMSQEIFFKAILRIFLKRPLSGVNECTHFPGMGSLSVTCLRTPIYILLVCHSLQLSFQAFSMDWGSDTTNGLIERFHSTFKHRLAKVIENSSITLKCAIDRILFDVWSTPAAAATGSTPLTFISLIWRS